VVKGRIQLVLGSLVAALGANLGSSSEHIRSSAATAMDTLLTVAEPAALAQGLAHAMMNSSGSSRSKPAMAERLACIVPQVGASLDLDLSKSRPARRCRGELCIGCLLKHMPPTCELCSDPHQHTVLPEPLSVLLACGGELCCGLPDACLSGVRCTGTNLRWWPSRCCQQHFPWRWRREERSGLQPPSCWAPWPTLMGPAAW